MWSRVCPSEFLHRSDLVSNLMWWEIQVFSQTEAYESLTNRRGLNFQSPVSQLPKVCVNCAHTSATHSHSFITAIGLRGLGYCETDWFVRLVLRLAWAWQKGEVNWIEKPELCVFSHGANVAISLTHLNKSTHNSSHTTLPFLSVLSLQCYSLMAGLSHVELRQNQNIAIKK